MAQPGAARSTPSSTTTRRPVRQPKTARLAPNAAPDAPPEPTWTPEATVAPKLATLPKPTEVEPRRMPNWDGGANELPDARWEHATPPPPRRQPERPPAEVSSPERPARDKAFTVKAALAALLVVFLTVAVVMVLLRHSGTTPTRSAQVVVAAPSDVARAQASTRELNAETDATRAALHQLPGIPTPLNVGAVINPYVESLRSYGTFLATAKLPGGPRPAAALTQTLVTQDLQHLETINGLPALRLGSYLEQFTLDAARFQAALDSLQQSLAGATR